MHLKEWRISQDCTAKEMADRWGYSQANFCRWELGQALPRPKIMRQIAQRTGGKVMPNDFVEAYIYD